MGYHSSQRKFISTYDLRITLPSLYRLSFETDENTPRAYTVFLYYQKSKTMLHFFSNLRHLIHQDKVELAVTASQIETESEAWLAFNRPLK